MAERLPLDVLPTLSVIVPVLNEAGAIVGTLGDLQAMRAAGAEVILVDGGSSDATLQLALPLVDRVITAARGRASQMNAGAAVAGGDTILFLHADTRLPPGAHHAILQGLATSAKAWGRFDVIIEGEQKMLKLIAAMMNWRSRLTGMATGDQAIFVRRADFVAVGGFPAQALMEDIEISRRLKRRSAPLCLAQKVRTSGRRWSTAGVWRTIVLMWHLRLLYWLGVPADKLAEKYK
ncbi:MAG: TIGR04283 family arsenosugar biosynthesis glycosyltransferase [Undibacterium sp.]|nr:TIGR04283 family arsenosugar biosynthesis glycosyltransferase [Undibacterium sp.]